jgi:hypothetical protein
LLPPPIRWIDRPGAQPRSRGESHDDGICDEQRNDRGAAYATPDRRSAFVTIETRQDTEAGFFMHRLSKQQPLAR